MKTFLFAFWIGAASCGAATTIEISAKFVDLAAGSAIPDKPELLAKTKGVDVLSAPKVVTNPGQMATIEVNQNVSAPDGSVVPLGVTLTVKPSFTPKGNIAFSGKASDRFKHGDQEGESLSVHTFVARETYFKGWTPSGSTVVLSGTPATSSAAKKDASAPAKARELVIYLTFRKIVTDPPKKPATTAKSSKSSTSSKSTGTKASSSKSGSGGTSKSSTTRKKSSKK